MTKKVRWTFDAHPTIWMVLNWMARGSLIAEVIALASGVPSLGLFAASLVLKVSPDVLAASVAGPQGVIARAVLASIFWISLGVSSALHIIATVGPANRHSNPRELS